MNPATAFAVTLVDELVRCGLAEAVLAPGSRSAPLAMALWDRAERDAGQGQGPRDEVAGAAGQRGAPGGRPPGLARGGFRGGLPPGSAPGNPGGRPPSGAPLRLHVRIDERSAAFLALGLAKASRRPVALVCTSGTAAAHFHGAVIEASEAGVPLLVLTADRPPELRGTGANQTIDQVKLYGDAVRWFCEAGVPEARPGMNGYWRSLACRAWAAAGGAGVGFPGPVHLNLPLREPLVPGVPDAAGGRSDGWPEPLAGRPDGGPWTAFPAAPAPGVLDLPWAERGVIICGDGCADPAALLHLAQQAGWPVLAEPSSGARAGPMSMTAYQYLLESPGFVAEHRPGRQRVRRAPRPVPRAARLHRNSGAGPPRARRRARARATGPTRRAAPPTWSQAVSAGREPGADSGLAGVLARGRHGGQRRGGRHPRRRRERSPSRGSPATWRRPCRTARCCGRRPACPSATWTSRWRRGPG